MKENCVDNLKEMHQWICKYHMLKQENEELRDRCEALEKDFRRKAEILEKKQNENYEKEKKGLVAKIDELEKEKKELVTKIDELEKENNHLRERFINKFMRKIRGC